MRKLCIVNKTRCYCCFFLDILCYPSLWVAHWICWIYCLDLFKYLSFFYFFFFFESLILTNFFLKQQSYLSWPCLHFSLIQAIYLWSKFFIFRWTSLKFISRLDLDNFSCRYQLAFYWLMKITVWKMKVSILMLLYKMYMYPTLH